MGNEDERRLILDMISSGKITAEEGLRLLSSLPDEEAEADEASDEEAGAQMGAEAAAWIEPPPAVPDPPLPEPPRPPPDTQSLPPAESLPPAGAGAAGAGAAESESAGGSSSGPPLEGEAVNSFRRAGLPAVAERWRRWWRLPMAVGIVLTILGAVLMFQALQASGIGFWFLCAWLPFLMGVAVVALAWHSRAARWLHLRVHQAHGERPRTIAISFPLPLNLASWALRTFRNRIPGMQAPNVDELLVELERSTSPETPLYLEVEEGEDGERVEIFIG